MVLIINQFLSNPFIEIMKELRRVDDNIIPRMNMTDTHSEKACGEFFSQLAESYRKRENAVDYCLKVLYSLRG